MSVPAYTSDELYHTKICKYYLVGCDKSGCSFAHSKEELRVKHCKFGDKCFKKENCEGYHQGENPTSDEMLAKCLKKIAVIQPKINTLNSEIKKKTDEVINKIKKDEHDFDYYSDSSPTSSEGDSHEKYCKDLEYDSDDEVNIILEETVYPFNFKLLMTLAQKERLYQYFINEDIHVIGV